MKEHGIGTLGFPWSLQQEFGGKGVLVKSSKEHVKPQKKNKLSMVLPLVIKISDEDK